MDDFISRQEAIDGFYEMASDIDHLCTVGDYILVLESLPAHPEIIQCKDCKYSEHWYRDKRRCFLWHETGIDVFEDGYCNYAERRTDGMDN